MCFYHGDDGWHPEVYEAGTETAGADRRCWECGGVIPAGQEFYHVHMQEHEECRSCEWGGDTDETCVECACENPDHGETEDYDCCLDCRRVLHAVQISEEEAGCKHDEALCPLGELRQAMHDEGERYRKKALQLYPDLAPHLDRLAAPVLRGGE